MSYKRNPGRDSSNNRHPNSRKNLLEKDSSDHRRKVKMNAINKPNETRSGFQPELWVDFLLSVESEIHKALDKCLIYQQDKFWESGRPDAGMLLLEMREFVDFVERRHPEVLAEAYQRNVEDM